MPGTEEQALIAAIARNSGNVLSLPSAGMLRHCKSRFLGQQNNDIVIESAGDEAALIHALIASKENCVVTFKNGFNKSAFATRLISVIPDWRMNDQTSANALLIAFPAVIKTLQRRAHYRARVPAETAIRVRVWRIAERVYIKENPSFTQEVLCELLDLSVGGIGVRFYSKDGKPPKISTADRLRIQITAGDEPFILEGRMRDPKPGDDPAKPRAGVGFKKLEDNLEGRRIVAQLTRIVGDLQREELRRQRLGLAEAG